MVTKGKSTHQRRPTKAGGFCTMALHAQHVQRHGAEASSRRRRHFHQRGQLCGFETGAATDMFDLIGVVERWDELCALLNQLLPVPVGSH